MPDLQTALSKAIQQWTTDDNTDTAPAVEAPTTKASRFQPTNNVSRVTFNTVRDNPGLTRVEVANRLRAQGFRYDSVHALLTQMLNQELIAEESGSRKLRALVQEYTPLKTALRRKPKTVEKAVDKPKRKYTRRAVVSLPVEAVGGVAALLPTKEDMTSKVMISASWSADQIMDHLSIKQARALYDELKTIFGK